VSMNQCRYRLTFCPPYRLRTRSNFSRVIRIEGVLAEAIRRVHNDECMSSKFINDLELA
jgi:phosphoribosylpyrophosphate synthetase